MKTMNPERGLERVLVALERDLLDATGRGDPGRCQGSRHEPGHERLSRVFWGYAACAHAIHAPEGLPGEARFERSPPGAEG